MLTPEERRARKRAYYLANQEKIKAKVRDYREKNKDKIAERLKAARKKDPEKWKEYSRNQYQKHKEKRLEECRAYHHKNRDKLCEQMRTRYYENAEERKAKQREYYKKNKEKVLAYQKEYAQKNPDKVRGRSRAYRMAHLERLRAFDRERAKNLSPARIRSAKAWFRNNRDRVNGYQKDKRMKALTLLGRRCGQCGWDDLLDVLEIDHIVPFSKLGIKRPKSSAASSYAVLRNPELFQLLCANCHAIKTAMEKRSRNPNVTKAKRKYQRARERLIALFGGRCACCGYNQNSLAFEFDHVEPIWGVGRSSAVHHVRRNPVLFQMLCANCHAVKTILDRREKRRRTNEEGEAAE